MQDFTGKVAVITGAASGIGAALARRCAGEGMSVVLADVSEQGLAEVAAAVQAMGAEVLSQRTDVAVAAEVEALAEAAWRRFGQVDLLFNNAGVLLTGSSWECSVEDWRWLLDINLMGVIHGVTSFVPRMLAQGTPGHIVNTSSLAGLLAAPLMGPYTVSKQAVLALTETLHYELDGNTPLGVSVLCPGPIATAIAGSAEGRPTPAEPSAAQRQLQEFLGRGIAEGMEPDQCAERVFAGIRESRFWIFTHEDFKPEYQRRVQSVLDGTNPTYQVYVTEK
jgi:NAD(P)-dependent dehydrogenase (short-subunit alcohol dehydrogenase family)